MVCTKVKKRILSVMLSILSCLFLFSPLTSGAVESIQTHGKCGDNITWDLDEYGTLTLSGTGAMYDFDEKNTSSWWGNGIKKIVVNNGVTRIGDEAFLNCYAVESIELPTSLTDIGNGVFCACESLKSVTIPHNVAKIGKDLFKNSGVRTVFAMKDLNPSVPEGATFYGYETTGEMKDGVIEAILHLQYGQAAPKDEIAKPYKLEVDYSYHNLGTEEKIGSLTQYVADDGTVSRVIDPSGARVTWVRLNGKWYGLDSAGFQAGDVFRIKLADDATRAKLDESAVKDTLRAFTIEVRHPDGTLCTEHPKSFDVYVQYDTASNVRAVCIDDGTDVQLDVNTMDWGMKDGNSKIRVAKLTLDKFGSFAIYLADDGSGTKGSSYSSKTADTVTNNMLLGLPAFMMLALGGIYVSLKKKRTE